MPEVEVNNTNCDSNMEGDVCKMSKLHLHRNKPKNNEEFASEIHKDASLETYESKNANGKQNDIRSRRPVSERTAWN